ncbi:MAG: ABC transporter substrate-binding protein [Phycisphaerales bacterium]|nr:ABC transporter substrate-binding protein [Phycisphaerales bacterium]
MCIVCLSPAVTDLLLALDLGDRIVGRDSWEEQLPDSVPRVGDLTSIDLEALIELQPTDVVLQAARQGAPARIEEIARQRGWNLINLQIDGVADIEHAVRDLAAGLSFTAERDSRAAVAARGEALIAEMRAALEPMPREVADRLGPIMVLYFTDPPSAYGPGSYIGDILESLGAQNALSGGAWQEIDLERVVAAQPWALIIAKPGADDWTAAHPESALGSVARLNLDCVRAGRLAVLRHPHSQLPGASVIGVAGEMRGILTRLAGHPDQPEPPEP